jgi:hypothetical protein
LNANSSSFANTAFSVNGANVVGEVAVANTVRNPSPPNITSVGTLTSLTSGAATIHGHFTANGNAQFNQDVYFAGNVTIPGTINVITGNSGQFFGNVVTGFDALYAGLPSGYNLLPQEVTQFSTNFDGYAQVNARNINGGQQATTDYVATADDGTDSTNFVNLGIAGSGYNGLLANNSLGNSLFANDSYLYAQGNVVGGNLVLGTVRSGAEVRVITGDSDLANVRATFSNTGLAVNGNITAQGTTTAAAFNSLALPNSRLVYVDATKTGTYNQNGTAEQPFQTIAVAVAWANSSGFTSVSFVLSTGTFAEGAFGCGEHPQI